MAKKRRQSDNSLMIVAVIAIVAVVIMVMNSGGNLPTGEGENLLGLKKALTNPIIQKKLDKENVLPGLIRTTINKDQSDWHNLLIGTKNKISKVKVPVHSYCRWSGYQPPGAPEDLLNYLCNDINNHIAKVDEWFLAEQCIALFWPGSDLTQICEWISYPINDWEALTICKASDMTPKHCDCSHPLGRYDGFLDVEWLNLLPLGYFPIARCETNKGYTILVDGEGLESVWPNHVGLVDGAPCIVNIESDCQYNCFWIGGVLEGGCGLIFGDTGPFIWTPKTSSGKVHWSKIQPESDPVYPD